MICIDMYCNDMITYFRSALVKHDLAVSNKFIISFDSNVFIFPAYVITRLVFLSLSI